MQTNEVSNPGTPKTPIAVKYAGIDYSMGQSNIDTQTGIRYGVIRQHSVGAEVMGDIASGPHSKDLGWEAFVEEFKLNVRQFASPFMHASLVDRFVEYAADFDWLGECYYPDALKFEYDDGKYLIRRCLDNDMVVIRSPYYTHAQFCSPCVPGACNLESPCDDGPKTYCLGHDFFDGRAPYRVFEVSTGNEVQP